MDPANHNLLEGAVFAIPNDPGAMPVYPQWVAPTAVKMINVTFLCNKNYYLSYKNIARACFHMFDENIGAQFKVSNPPTHWVEFKDVRYRNPRPTAGFLLKVKHDDVVEQQHIVQ